VTERRAKRRERRGDEDVGRRLRAIRMRRGLTLRALGERVGVTGSSISQIERGQTSPSVSTLMALVTELGVTLDEVFVPKEGRPESFGAGAVRPDGSVYERVANATATGQVAPVGLLSLAGPASRARLDLGSGVHWEPNSAT
jgi:transcriptional regulator with XRE-family HTH domain